MLRNYPKIALRTLWKQKGITAINVLGLAAGMAVCLLVGLLFWDQLTHDDFHPGADRIYRVNSLMANDDGPSTASPLPLAPAIREGVTGIETATRMRDFSRTLVLNNQGVKVEGLYAEPSFFDLFGFELATGNAEQALVKPYTAVVTRDLARRLYGEKDPMGRTFQLRNGQSVTITGVINRSAYPSQLGFEVLLSFPTLRRTQPALHADSLQADWYKGIFDTTTFLRIAKGQDPASIESSLERLRRRHLTFTEEESPAAQKKRARVQRLQLEPLSAVPFSNVEPNITQGTLYGPFDLIPAGLALLILLAAGFNYVNLSTARSLTRGREVGVRKTVGAHRKQVMGQFITEAVIVTVLALGLALLILEGLVPLFNRLSIVHKAGIGISLEPGLRFYGMAVLFAVGLGALAGLYPAWHLSSFQPAQVLKAGVQAKTPGFQWMTPRKVLIVFQFLITFVVIVTGTVLYRQFRHVKTATYPLQIDRVVRVELQEADQKTFQQAARRQPGVQKVGAASDVGDILAGVQNRCGVKPISGNPGANVRPQCHNLNYEALQVLDLPLIASKNLTETRFESGRTVLLTKAGVEALGVSTPEKALGKQLKIQVDVNKWQRVRIAGVMKNLAPHDGSGFAAEGVLFHYRPENFQVALARVAPGQDSSALHRLQSTWETMATDPFRGNFMRAHLGEEFANALAEFGGVIGVLEVLGVLISCLGLLGIVTYVVRTRTREIGVRKALGATVTSIVGLLSRNVLGLVGTAILIGMPIAWIISRMILRNFPVSSIDFGLVTLLLVAVVMMGLAFAAVASPTLRAARTDPAQTLRDE